MIVVHRGSPLLDSGMGIENGSIPCILVVPTKRSRIRCKQVKTIGNRRLPRHLRPDIHRLFHLRVEISEPHNIEASRPSPKRETTRIGRSLRYT